MGHCLRVRRSSSMSVWHVDRSRPRRIIDRWVSLCLLLRGLPRVRALPRTARRARRSRWHRHLPDRARARAARDRSGHASVRAVFAQGASLVRRLLQDADREHGSDAGLPDRRDDPCRHGSRNRNAFSRRGPGCAVVPNLRTLRSWAAATGCAATAFHEHFRSTQLEAAVLASARASPPEPVLRRARGPARHTANLASLPHAALTTKRCVRSCSLALPTYVSVHRGSRAACSSSDSPCRRCTPRSTTRPGASTSCRSRSPPTRH
jgi:hypothetical protein